MTNTDKYHQPWPAPPHASAGSSTIYRLAIVSIFVGIAVLFIKLYAFYLTSSIALYSDALESTVNIASAIAVLIAVRIAAKPADQNFPYGHHKAEYFSAVLEGVMIVIAALLIFREAYSGFFQPRILETSFAGLFVNGIASLINGFWCYILLKKGRQHQSPALLADGWHLLSDVISSVGVTAGLLLAYITGWHLLDPILASLVAINILWSGWRIIRDSVSGLMDQAVDAETLDKFYTIIAAEAKDAIEVHDIRTRQAGNMIFIDFHLVVPGQMSVLEAHEICDRIEDALELSAPQILVTIHVEPENKAKNVGIVNR